MLARICIIDYESHERLMLLLGMISLCPWLYAQISTLEGLRVLSDLTT